MRDSEQRRPQLRRLGDTLGAWYTPLAVAIALGAWLWTGDPVRFLAVLVVATPCPLLIAIPVAIIGSISLAATRSIVIRDPAILETIDRCRTMVLDKTGTLTFGQLHAHRPPDRDGRGRRRVLRWPRASSATRNTRSRSRFSTPPHATMPCSPTRNAARAAGQGLEGVVDGPRCASRAPAGGSGGFGAALPPIAAGLE
jgi:cation transport ATPase